MTLQNHSEKQDLGFNVWVELKAERLLENMHLIRAAAGSDNDVLAVIKANAYGHGLRQVARALDGHVLYLGVSSIKEALELKDLELKSRIFLFGRLFPNEIGAALLDGITLSVSSFSEADDISKAAQALGKNVRIHAKVDSGMGRMGIPFDRALTDIEKISKLPAIELEGVYSHFPSAETDDAFRTKQIRDFELLVRALEAKDIKLRFKHLQNSAACLSVKTKCTNLIRPGLFLYGISSGLTPQPQMPKLKPVLSLKAKIIHVKRLAPGATVGYGRRFTAKDPATIGILPIGYAQGYSFSAWEKAHILYQGKRFPLAGRISMDYMTVNFGDQYVRAGDTVTLLGEDGDDCITANEIAAWAGTIPYEIVTALQNYLPRIIV
ncbi:MAG TPA: alanine racemase [Candidatus Omnitrophica bacterium]|nr:alanine racemase [Candidatus Omnitrophota bacterium]